MGLGSGLRSGILHNQTCTAVGDKMLGQRFFFYSSLYSGNLSQLSPSMYALVDVFILAVQTCLPNKRRLEPPIFSSKREYTYSNKVDRLQTLRHGRTLSPETCRKKRRQESRPPRGVCSHRSVVRSGDPCLGEFFRGNRSSHRNRHPPIRDTHLGRDSRVPCHGGKFARRIAEELLRVTDLHDSSSIHHDD